MKSAARDGGSWIPAIEDDRKDPPVDGRFPTLAIGNDRA